MDDARAEFHGIFDGGREIQRLGPVPTRTGTMRASGATPENPALSLVRPAATPAAWVPEIFSALAGRGRWPQFGWMFGPSRG